ncbi:MAG TPA: DUF4910 domain-containing protein [Bacillales bacterium]
MTDSNEIKEMDRLFDRLFPITRSITGPGLRETLNILSEYLPLELFGLETGTKVFDWKIPKEWRIREAWLKGLDGKKIIDFRNHNLHVLNYSTAVDRKMTLEQLKPNLHTIPQLPEAIPYVTSYYKERWGFSLPHRLFEQLKDEEYHAYIDSEHVDGELNFAHAILSGESEKEILISTYVCHPSMANNELSGPIVAAFLYNRLAQWKNRRFTYRFVFVPETIGSLSYLYRFGEELKGKLHAGLVLTCLGGDQSLSYKMSREEDTPVNRVVSHLFDRSALEGNVRPFTPAFGSDERQYCSPGFNLPVGQVSRMVYGKYDGYHNSLDNKETMTIEALNRSVDELEELLEAVELEGYYVNTSPYGEVKLDQHGLYPDSNGPKTRGKSTNQKADHRTQLHRILTVLNYADGSHSLIDIAEKCHCSIVDLEEITQLLKNKGLLKGPFAEKRGLFS